MTKSLQASSANKSSGVKNVYRTSTGKWYAKVTKNGKTKRSEPTDDFERARNAARELRMELGVL